MKMTTETANKIFDVMANEGKHQQQYIDSYREEFVEKALKGGLYEYWYPTKAGSQIKMYFQYWNPTAVEVRFYAQTLNTVHDKTLVEDAHKALEAAGFVTF